MTSAEVRALLDDVFEEEALVLGGLMEIHGVSSMFVRQLFGSLLAIRAHALERLDGSAGSPTNQTPVGGTNRPAIDEFLASLGRHRSNPACSA